MQDYSITDLFTFPFSNSLAASSTLRVGPSHLEAWFVSPGLFSFPLEKIPIILHACIACTYDRVGALREIWGGGRVY